MHVTDGVLLQTGLTNLPTQNGASLKKKKDNYSQSRKVGHRF